MAIISSTIKVDISVVPGRVEHILLGASCSTAEVPQYKALFRESRDVFSWTYSKMSGLDPSIVEHHIDTWPDASPLRQKQHPLHLAKALAIKAEIDNICKDGFIYPITYTSWVSNPVPVNKKHGNIHVCTDYHDLNAACSKDNYPMPFIDQVINNCVGHEILSFMDGVLCYNHIIIR